MRSTSFLGPITVIILSLTVSFNTYAAKVVSGDNNSVAVAIDKYKDPEKSLAKTTKKAKKHCKKYNKTPRLERTEKAGKKDKGAIVYYSCISKDSESSEKETTKKSEISSEDSDYNGY